jgi:hypothetical protein
MGRLGAPETYMLGYGPFSIKRIHKVSAKR